MSRFNELISELCPDGVKYKTIKEFASVSIGEFVHQNKQNPNYPYPVYNGGTTNTGFYDEYNRTANKIIVSARGANAGFVNRVFVNFWSGNSCYTISIEDKLIDWNFVYYYLKSNEGKLINIQQKGGIPAVSKKQVEEFRVPLPPLPVQQEIVRILDNFTELTAELTARKKQYEYYKKSFLSQSSTAFVTKLGEVATLKTGSKPKEIFEEKDNFEYINAGTSNSGYVRSFNCEGDTVTTPSRGQGGIGFVGYQKNSFWLGPLCYRIKSKDTNILLNRYLYHYLSCFNDKIMQYKNEGGTPSVNASDLVNIAIDIPSINEQKRIITILDRFDILCNDLNSGLPAEIEARRKQYEYYRDKLLTFKEASA